MTGTQPHRTPEELNAMIPRERSNGVTLEEPPWMAEPPRAVPEADDLPTTWTVRELADMRSADDEYIIADGILTRGGKMLIYAKSGAGKTTLLDFVAGPLSTGRPFLGRYPIDRARRVLVVQGELSQPEMTSHAQTLVGSGYTDDNLRFARMTNLKLPAGEETLRAMILRDRIEVVALDPWYRLFSGESSDKPEQVGTLFDVCDKLLDDGLVEAVVVVHHANVTGLRTAGSWVFEGWPSTILRLETVAGVPMHRKLTYEKVRAPSSTLQAKAETIVLGDEGYRLVIPKADPVGAGELLAVAIVREVGGTIRRRDLVERLMARANVKDRAANKYMATAAQQGRLVSVPDGRETVYQLGPASLEEEA